jgi:hypothetical protein
VSEHLTPEEDTPLSHEREPELKDAGPPAEDAPGDPEGSSGAQEGISPWTDEAYSEDPEGPTQHTGG